MKNNANKKTIIYESFMSLLALVAVIIAFLDLLHKIDLFNALCLQTIEYCIWIVFCIDYFARLVKAPQKTLFLKQNILDLLAIIPFSDLFRGFKLFKLFKILKLFVYFARFTRRQQKFLRTNGFIYSLYITLVTILLGSSAIYMVEKGSTVETFGDALWWSFVTTTTVGYGDISPQTWEGRVIAVVLMIVGIGFLGMLTGTIATYFLKSTTNNETIENVDTTHIDVSGLTKEQIQQVTDFVNFLKSK